MAQAPFQLAFSLHGHASDVRAIAAPSRQVPLLLSGSRDGSAIVWGPSAKGREWDVKLRVEGPEKKYVSCVGMLRAQGEAFLLVGSSSGILSTYTLPSPTSPPPPSGEMQEPYHTLIEHRQNLCCLDTSEKGLIATGSWDKTVVVWKDFKKVITIENHDQAVWAVKFVGEDRLLTASADKKIILHQLEVGTGRSKPLREYSGHTEPIRGLSLTADGKGFWSSANDGLVNLYDLGKTTPRQSLSGHTSFVYSVAALPDGSGAVSSGEDGTLRVWSETELLQTIPHSSNSLWSCAVVPSATGSGWYIASSANDSTIRLFTRSEELMAPQSEREQWDKDVSSRQLDKSQVGDVKHSDLPGMEALGREGKRDGQVIMIKNNGVVEAYQWSQGASTWQQIGQVVDAIGSGRKQLYEGKEYDYVFDVDVSEGMPPLKLPYNVSENPWMAAQKFLEKNELPATYADQVVQFIEKNTGGVQLGQAGAETYSDPLTGGSRYTGAASSSQQQSYGGADPFTGGGAYSSSPAAPTRSQGILPVKTFLGFKQMNVNAAKGKIAQLNEEIKSSSSEAAFSAQDEANMAEIYALLSLPGAALPDVNAPAANERYQPEAYLQSVLRWPEDKRFPLVDLARCLAAVSPAFGAVQSVTSSLLKACDWAAPSPTSKSRDVNTLLALRGLANLFLTKNGRSTVASQTNAAELLGALKSGKSWNELGTRKVPLVTIALNYSILAVNNEFPVSCSTALLNLIEFVLGNETEDSETLYRAIVALGNILVSTSVAGNLQVGTVQNAKQLAQERATKLGEKRLVDLATEIQSLMS